MARLIRESERQNYKALYIFTFSRGKPAANRDILDMCRLDASQFHSGVVDWRALKHKRE
ncbi:MAG: hypothetical protein HF976_10050 [ANME-2 cluster archaeon]|nr:hypothetical protein [ANME-2 cluster archaeon]MBC2701735.1 hypothetical protein [ANME-2 cluster archaeon]MBC2707899.1 hypothetical protein [ANME-2 cluster archaeon]MBC2748604.1 hypothetical protein [ANME-2 cluster archaeon]